MISVIVCSKSDSLFSALSLNIAQTIGETYELIRVDNKLNKYSICSAYNYGSAKAHNPLVCFVHEDVIFTTNGWGSKLLAHFKSLPDAGLIGVAGAVSISKMPGGWWQSEDDNYEIKRMNIIHRMVGADNNNEFFYFNPGSDLQSEVCVVDGVFMAVDIKVLANCWFDEDMLTGFHGYDIDFSLQVIQYKKAYVVFDILLEHYSAGKRDCNWMNAMLAVHHKWKAYLPAGNINRNSSQIIYQNGWKRLKKNMVQWLQYERNIFRLIKKYNSYIGLLDKPVNFLKFSGDYLRGIRLIFLLWLKQR